MAMRYRHTLKFTIGHGVSGKVELAPTDRTRALRLTTQVVPDYDVLSLCAGDLV